jgi:hypothetical protein
VNTDASDQKFGYLLNLGKVAVDFIKTLQLLLDKLPDKSFRISVCEVHRWVEPLSEVKSTLSRKCENNTWQKFHLLDLIKSLLECRCFFLVATLIRAWFATTSSVFGKHFFHRGFFGIYGFALEINLLLLFLFLSLLVVGRVGIIFLFVFSILTFLIIGKPEGFSLVGNHLEIVLVDGVFLVFD